MTDAVATLPILIAPHATLRVKCQPVADHDDSIRDLAARMLATMYAAPGIGLAAPQVGTTRRLFVIDLQEQDGRQPHVLINPEIAAVSDELVGREEGCLSIPGQYAEVIRPSWVRMRYIDLEGAHREIEGSGLMAACLQHELDHLNGVLFIDHISMLKRNILMRRLAKEQRQKKGA